MRFLFQSFLGSARQQRRRRARQATLVPCESFESRRVLSALTGLEATEELVTYPAHLEASAESLSDAAMTEPSVVASVEWGATELLIVGPSAPAPDGTLQEDTDATAFDGEFNELAQDGRLPPETLDTLFADVEEFSGLPDRGGPHPPHRRAFSPVEGSQTDVFDGEAGEVAEPSAQAEADTDSSQAAVDNVAGGNPAAVRTVARDGFVEIPHSTLTPWEPHTQRPETAGADEAAGRQHAGALQSDPASDEAVPTQGDSTSAVQAALEFFNRQTEGGFVDAGLEQLHAASGIAGANRAGGLGSSLEAGIGRLNPFEEQSHTTQLTAVELRQVAESDAGREVHVSAAAALAGIVFGAVGIRTRSFGRLRDLVRRAVGGLLTLCAVRR